MRTTRKYPSIDLMKLYTLGSKNGWNDFLTECALNKDINKLARVKYQISAGMTDLANQKLNTPEMDIWFARLIKSLELTAKRIIKLKHPMPGDNPLTDKKIKADTLEIKRKRDLEINKFMHDSRF